MTLLRVAAAVEVATLVVLLVNLATVHLPAVSGAIGPVHGTAYLMIVVATALRSGAPAAARWWSLVPAIGGIAVVRLLQRRSEPAVDE